ncbi:MAG: LacI family DNA-binding transcriptional regulator [Agrococcus casei]|uniref:LacI family DNA-binding transcriptional regulator n=1 Tax=Agrococcus casei TaxID=343512 RepID=UPI003F91648E
MASKRATILDVAAKAGVSTTTVSDALRGRGRISAETRASVERAASDIGYVPNRAARSLRIAEYGVIGLQLPQTLSRSEFYMSTTFGVLERCANSDYDVTLISSSRKSAPPDVDGVIVVDPVVGDRGVQRALQLEVPIVSMERIIDADVKAALVTADYEGAVHSLLDTLSEGGAKRIGLLSAVAETDWARRVRSEYERWCKGGGAVADFELHSVKDSDEIWVEGAQALLGRGCDAVLCGPPTAAHALLVATAAADLELGRDLLAACVVDAPSLATSLPPITSVDLQPRASGHAAVDLLLAILRSESPADAVVPIESILTVRDSTGVVTA